jgi:hypothetical protein
MIDPLTESPVSLTQAAKLDCFPERRAGSRINVATLYRWSTIGCRGVVLETIQIGSTRCTSREALGRFFRALTDQAAGKPAVATSTPAERQRQIRAAQARLAAAGV